MHLMDRRQFKLSYIAKEVFTLAWDDTSGDSKKAYFTKTAFKTLFYIYGNLIKWPYMYGRRRRQIFLGIIRDN